MRVAFVVLAILVGVGLIVMFGTIRAMEKGVPAMQYRISFAGGSTNCTVRVIWPVTNQFAVSKDGQALVEIPALPHGCSLICLGIKLTDGSPRSRIIVEVLRGVQVVRRLSLRELERLPSDPAGAKKLGL